MSIADCEAFPERIEAVERFLDEPEFEAFLENDWCRRRDCHPLIAASSSLAIQDNMQKQTRQVWRDEVVSAMRRELPAFEPFQKRIRGEERGVVKFCRKAGLIVWAVVFRPLEESFDVYVGWSTDGGYPYERAVKAEPRSSQSTMLPLIRVSDRTGLASYLLWEVAGLETMSLDDWMQKAAREYFSRAAREISVKESQDVVRPRIVEAIEELRQFGVPYLQKMAPLP